MDTRISNAIAAELRKWQADGRRNAADSMVRIAELLHSHGADLDLPTFYARRDGRVLAR
jgi:uncharacterized protein involved in tellurium resistance